jgi:2-phospho-L-lactate guanylyltransferase
VLTDVPRREPVSVVVLAKHASQAKTRLGLPPEQARLTALWLAALTVRTAVTSNSVGRVVVVTSDAAIAADATSAGASVVSERRSLGMNRAAALGRRYALTLETKAPVAVLVADLPHLRCDELDEVISQFHDREAALFVQDHHGLGTTFLVHGPESFLATRFGQNSAQAHRRLEYAPATGSLYGLRTDLDTPDDLRGYDERGRVDVLREQGHHGDGT